ncbi:YkgJ family cysteine cluster protein [Desulfolucanica intricata]|uniref:YkgJ family cysteine cluster protein n=1 Tax=Desulfolucanica intricata TaxID=1285191 RepID=UPI0008340EF1|nr:YkgJ family cysteine cluster protein [Desulfolucanica intricata]
MKEKKVKVMTKKFNGQTGYDLEITDERATVQDYLNALNEAIIRASLFRSRTKVRKCEGCDLCCAERVPLTWIDICRLREIMKHRSATIQKVLDKYGYIVVDGPVVDIMLRRSQDNRCSLLDRSKGLCTIYHIRPLVCQTFICCPLSRRAERLREAVVNKGEDELVRMWLLEARAEHKKPLIHEGYRPRPELRDWPPTPFAGCTNYNEVYLKSLCSKSLWTELYNNRERKD